MPIHNLTSIGSFRQQIVIGGLDITEYVIAGQTTRSLSNPTGTFTLYLRPIIENNIMKRLPVDLNDYVEIRLDRKMSGNIRTVMRGFLDNEDMSEKPSPSLDGSPSRQHVLSGSDLGKMLERRQIFIPPSVDMKSINQIYDPLNLMKELMSSTLAGAPLPGNEGKYYQPLGRWVEFFLEKIYKGEYEHMVNANKPAHSPQFSFKVETDLPTLSDPSGDSPGQEKFYVYLAPLHNNTQGSFWQFIEYFAIRPFIESFIREDIDKTTFHFRWTPHRKKFAMGNDESGRTTFGYDYPRQFHNGRYWWSGPGGRPKNGIDRVELTTGHILEKRIRRQELDRCTYFYVVPKLFPSTAGASSYEPTGSENQNQYGANPYWDESGIKQFGIRPMVIEIPWMPIMDRPNTSEADPLNPAAGSSGKEFVLDVVNSLHDLNAWLQDSFTYTDQLYSGYITVWGNTNIEVGSELKITNTGELYYIESVDHSWQIYPSVQFITRLGVTRGTMPTNFDPARTQFSVVSNNIKATMGTAYAGSPEEIGATVRAPSADTTSPAVNEPIDLPPRYSNLMPE